ncbi:MAG: L-threonylcarbamoyladenylate synthase, partial [Bradymonadaceae bacterium]
ILEATKGVPTVMRKERDTVGIRVPNHPITTALVERLGHPIATTSAMTDEQELIADPWTLEDLYEHIIDIVIDGGYVFPEPSTVIDLSGEFPVLVREGKGDIEGFEFVDVVEEEEEE